MELREIKSLIALMDEYGLVELEIEDKKGKIRLVRGSADNTNANADATPARRAQAKREKSSAADVAARLAPASTGSSGSEPEIGPNQVLVRSPMVGTFYRASSPGAAPMVEEGSPVRKGQPLCIIEAMKMMNEVEAEVSGSVVKFLCDNGQPVEYGQPLMIIAVG
jgi:acetyl-CoA carboxylase biotin carboxyl carrier protein